MRVTHRVRSSFYFFQMCSLNKCVLYRGINDVTFLPHHVTSPLHHVRTHGKRSQIERVLCRQNMFFTDRMYFLQIECVLYIDCIFYRQNVFSIDRMCFLQIECVFYRVLKEAASCQGMCLVQLTNTLPEPHHVRAHAAERLTKLTKLNQGTRGKRSRRPLRDVCASSAKLSCCARPSRQLGVVVS